MLNSIEYTTWRRNTRATGTRGSTQPDPVWIQRGTLVRRVKPVIVEEFIRIVQQQQPVHVHVQDSSCL